MTKDSISIPSEFMLGGSYESLLYYSLKLNLGGSNAWSMVLLLLELACIRNRASTGVLQ